MERPSILEGLYPQSSPSPSKSEGIWYLLSVEPGLCDTLLPLVLSWFQEGKIIPDFAVPFFKLMGFH